MSLRSTALVLATATAVVAIVQLSGSAVGAFPGNNGLIAFRSDRVPGVYELWVVFPNGARVRKLTAPGWSPSWSPGGRRIALVGYRRGGSEVFLVSASGRGLKRLTHNRVPDDSPTWSPDGKRILFVSAVRTNANEDLYKMRANGRGRKRLGATPLCESQPAWSSDGTKIAFLDACGNTPWPLYIMNPDGTGLQRLPTGGLGGPTWSPDSRQIALDDGLHIIVLNRDGSGIHTLTSGTEPACRQTARKSPSPAWSPASADHGLR